jgi:hypothetical protein
MKPPARIKPEAQIKKHARPEKIQEKGPLRPFFFIHMTIHLSNIGSIVPTSKQRSNIESNFPM